MENPSEAAAAVAGAKDDGLQLAAEVEQKGAVALLEGDLEKTYYVSVFFLLLFLHEVCFLMTC